MIGVHEARLTSEEQAELLRALERASRFDRGSPGRRELRRMFDRPETLDFLELLLAEHLGRTKP